MGKVVQLGTMVWRGEVRRELLLVGCGEDFCVNSLVVGIWVQGKNRPSRLQSWQLPEVIPGSRSDNSIPSIYAMLEGLALNEWVETVPLDFQLG